MARLRELLGELEPRCSVREGLRAFLVQGRACRREGRLELKHGGQGEIERVLSQERPLGQGEQEALLDLKSGLAQLLALSEGEAEARCEAVRAVDQALGRLWPRQAEAPLEVELRGLPPELSAGALRAALDLPPEGPLQPMEARRLRESVEGRRLAGRELGLGLPEGLSLPSLPREERFDAATRGGRAWLPHLDEEGRWSLTPEEVAVEQAGRLRADAVIDGLAGCGGNTIALARRGLEVVAVERDPGRAALLRRNLAALRPRGRVELRVGDLRQLLPELLHRRPKAALFLDPPWGAAGPEVQGEALFPPGLLPQLAGVAELHVKAPPAWDPTCLRALGHRWALFLEGRRRWPTLVTWVGQGRGGIGG